jgi:glycosyltransferase involved in cell wall biosynthesis
MPLVSIVTPLHNKGPYIEATLDSVQAQTLTDWELIVVENGSSDDGPDRVVSRAGTDPRIRMVRVSAAGPGAARNRGVSEATGEWVLFLDADDLIDPDYLETMVRSGAGADVVAGGWREFRDDGTGEEVRQRPPRWGASVSEVETDAIAGCPWIVHAALVRRAWMAEGRTWDESLDGHPHEDTAFWFRVVSGARLAWADGDGARYRLATATSRNERRDPARWVDALNGIVSSNLAFLRGQGRSPSAAQCDTMVRTLEAAWLAARKSGDEERADQTLSLIRQALAGSGSGWGMRLRRWVGVPAFNRLRGRK